MKQKGESYTTGFSTLDKVLGKFRPTQFVLLASRPFVGKSSFARTMAGNISVENNIPVAYFSLEHSKKNFCSLFLCTEMCVKLSDSNGYEWDNKATRLSKAPLYIDDTHPLMLDEFRQKTEKLVNEKGIKVIIIDYIQLMEISDSDNQLNSKERIRYIIRFLKQTATEMNVTIVGLSSMPRPIPGVIEPVPKMKQLCKAGLYYDFIKKNIDMVWLLDRRGMYCSDVNRSKAELIVAYKIVAVGIQ